LRRSAAFSIGRVFRDNDWNGAGHGSFDVVCCHKNIVASDVDDQGKYGIAQRDDLSEAFNIIFEKDDSCLKTASDRWQQGLNRLMF